MIRFMRPKDEASVRALYALAHPGWPLRPPQWFQAFPTLVAEADHRVVGYTSFSVAFPPSGNLPMRDGRMIYGEDLGIRPEYRGKGLGRLLADERLALGRRMGATAFLGLTWEANLPMVRIFEAQGMKPYARAPRHYHDNDPVADAVIYLGRL